MTVEQQLLTRLQRIEDELAITKLLASYGPSVDAGNADNAAALWALDGTYDVEDWLMAGRAGVHDMVGSTGHQELVAAGCCHFLGPAVVTVDGDRAVAVCESLVLLRDETSGYRVWRATANHFALERVDGRWLITTRTSRLLNGDPYAHTLLNLGLAGSTVPGQD
ncbi:nuclear transport factor 2 family protein [Mycobacterium sp. TNTM28]|uniref:Nuclear transport factor 2 family protein n=1 Tax=[Mycobacterium] fortunisiensis TaxID=2600579 RepID=A0ABS6KH00_9MYCO|nr:nuclear transport factor 2 family protein [[Mycobacterium] fortunisiensis]MBU9762838.1 nuclear transport factor 2 family protein [[Mycobacterium] fortunisiensis]